jgi:phosphoribosylformylglycinamidine synthase
MDPLINYTAHPSKYPMNPNGSADGVAAVVSDDGRVLAMMPHPERCYRSWQLPWCPHSWKDGFEKSKHYTPWIKVFQNAAEWCLSAK